MLLEAGDDAVAGGGEEVPAHDDADGGDGADGDVGEPVGAGHDARQGKEQEHREAREEGAFAEIAGGEADEDEEEHAVVTGETARGPVFARPAGELGNAVHHFAGFREELRGAGAVETEAFVERLGENLVENRTEQHGSTHGQHPATPGAALVAVVIDKDAQHREERDGIKGAQVRECHEVKEGRALRQQVVERKENCAVDRKPDAVVRGEVPAREKGHAEKIAQDDIGKIFQDGIRSLSGSVVVNI